MVYVEAMLDILPLPAWIVVIVGATIGFTALALKKRFENQNKEIETTSTKERLERVFINPVESTGVQTDVFLINQATDNKDRKIGKIKKINTSKVRINQKEKNDSGNINADDSEEKAYATMTVLPGTGLSLVGKTIGYKLLNNLTKNENNRSSFAEYYELPLNHLMISDRGILIDKDISIWKKNGLWRARTGDSQEMIQELTFMDTHEDAMHTFQELADVYSSMNTEFQKEKRLMDVKWQNIKDYKQGEKRKETRDAMES